MPASFGARACGTSWSGKRCSGNSDTTSCSTPLRGRIRPADSTRDSSPFAAAAILLPPSRFLLLHFLYQDHPTKLKVQTNSSYQDVVRTGSWTVKRRRWESNPLRNRFAGGRRAVWLQRRFHQCPRQESNRAPTRRMVPRPSQSRVRSATLRGRFVSAPRRGIEPRPAVSRTAMLVRYTRRAFTSSVSTRTRTWIWTFGESYAIPCTIETYGAMSFEPYQSFECLRAHKQRASTHQSSMLNSFQGRRLDLHQHRAVYKTAA